MSLQFLQLQKLLSVVPALLVAHHSCVSVPQIIGVFEAGTSDKSFYNCENLDFDLFVQNGHLHCSHLDGSHLNDLPENKPFDGPCSQASKQIIMWCMVI